MEFLLWFMDWVLHIDRHIAVFVSEHGAWVYALLFAIVFAETGLVVFPFLPGDSLLFIAGAFSANGNFNLGLLNLGLILSAVTGNTANYLIGRALGRRLDVRELKWLDKNALDKTHAFYEKHGGMAVIGARFLPIVRTFAPIVAGIVQMDKKKFHFFNVAGCVAWVASMILSGHFLQKWILEQFGFDLKHHLEVIVLGIVFVTTAPVLWKMITGKETIKAR